MVLLARHGDWIHAQMYHRQHPVNNDDQDDKNEDSTTSSTLTEDSSLSASPLNLHSWLCPLLQRALQQVFGQDAVLTPYNDDDATWHTICRDESTSRLVDMRPFQAQQQQEHSPLYTLLASWTHSMQQPTAVGIMPPDLPVSLDSWQFYVTAHPFDDLAWEYTSDKAIESAPLPWQPFLQQIFRDMHNADDIIQLKGELAQSGGMHRKFRQKTLVQLPQTSPTATASLDVLILLPPDMFINIEEAVEVSSTLATSTPILRHFILDIPPHRVIDQEEPTFASPAHGVLLRLEFPATSSAIVTLEWELLLHLRYPAPLKRADFVLIAILPLVPWSLTVAEPNGTVLTHVAFPLAAPSATPHYTWVAAGRQEYLLFVVVLTSLAALVGSAVMLRTLTTTA